MPSGLGGTPEIEAAVVEAIRGRLELGEQFCRSAERLLGAASGDQIDLRNAVSRAYYACHHAMRASALEYQSGDEPDHYEAIAAFTRIVARSGALRARLGTAADVTEQLSALIHWRHLADYYPYGSSYPLEAPIDFAAAASRAVGLARRLVDAVRALLREREGGTA